MIQGLRPEFEVEVERTGFVPTGRTVTRPVRVGDEVEPAIPPVIEVRGRGRPVVVDTDVDVRGRGSPVVVPVVERGRQNNRILG